MKILCHNEYEVYLAKGMQLKGGDATLTARKGDRAIRL